jgi:cyclophilin family peptidyl-prolyl cis-trans isomerase
VKRGLWICVILLASCSKQPDKGGTEPPDDPDRPNPVVLVDTSLGEFKVELFASKAPKTVKNFLDYVDDKFYDGTIFHRVMPNFMIQGGGFLPGMREKPVKAAIKNEANLSNRRGTIAMARTKHPDSATAQFFVNVRDNVDLDRGRMDPAGYAVFGKVIEGMDIVDKIKEVPARNVGGHEAVPFVDVVIKSIRRVETKETKDKDAKETKETK